MNKVVTIHLNGAAFQLEEGGYDALRAYLDSAARRLEGNPDREEILADIEQAIADKCQAALGAHKTVVLAREVSSIIEAMGPVEDASPGAGAPPEGEPDRRPTGARRLFRIREGRKIAGVCAGIAAYLDLDVSLVRLAFVVVALASLGAGAVAYLIVALVVPEAGTDAERAAATGGPSTAQDFIRLAREGYYEGMKTFTDKRAHREWRRRFRREMRGWRNAFRHEMGAHAEEWRGTLAAPRLRAAGVRDRPAAPFGPPPAPRAPPAGGAGLSPGDGGALRRPPSPPDSPSGRPSCF